MKRLTDAHDIAMQNIAKIAIVRNDLMPNKSVTDSDHYNDVFQKLWQRTINSIKPTDSEAAIIATLEVANREWKNICSNVNKTNKHIKLNRFGFEEQCKVVMETFKTDDTGSAS